VSAVQQHQVAAIGGAVVDEAHHHAVVLGVRCGRCEHELARLASQFDRANWIVDVVLEQNLGASPSDRTYYRVAIPVAAAHQPSTRQELLGGVVNRSVTFPLFNGLVGDRVSATSSWAVNTDG
jgi:hypothetical protein